MFRKVYAAAANIGELNLTNFAKSAAGRMESSRLPFMGIARDRDGDFREVPPPARRRAGALDLPTPPQGGSDGEVKARRSVDRCLR